MNKIYVSKAEIKHTNSKALLTIYTYNREKISLLKKIRRFSIYSVRYVKLFFKFLFVYNKEIGGKNFFSDFYKIIVKQIPSIPKFYGKRKKKNMRKKNYKQVINKLSKLKKITDILLNKKLNKFIEKINQLKLKNKESRIFKNDNSYFEELGIIQDVLIKLPNLRIFNFKQLRIIKNIIKKLPYSISCEFISIYSHFIKLNLLKNLLVKII